MARFAAWTIAVGVVGTIGYLVGDRYFHSGLNGVFVILATCGFLAVMLDPDNQDIALHAVGAFLFMVPTVYVLSLLVRLVLVTSELQPFTAHDFFWLPFVGALAGSAGRVLAGLKGAFEKAAESRPGRRDDEADRHFLATLPYRVPLAFLVAGLVGLPERPLAMVVVGISWGVVHTAASLVDTLLIDRRPVRDAGFAIWFFVILFGIVGVLAAVGAGFGDSPGSTFRLARLLAALALVASGMAACVLSYWLALVVAVVWRHWPAIREALTRTARLIAWTILVVPPGVVACYLAQRMLDPNLFGALVPYLLAVLAWRTFTTEPTEPFAATARGPRLILAASGASGLLLIAQTALDLAS